MTKRSGFTLTEMLIVIFIIALLIGLAIPYYSKTIENSRADDAVTTLNIVSAANQSFQADYNVYASGPLSEAGCAGFNSCTCLNANGQQNGTCIKGANVNACNLLSCGYITGVQFDTMPYTFAANDGTTNADPCGLGVQNYFACARRRTGQPPGTDTAPYTGWGYFVDQKGVEPWSSNGNFPPLPAS